MHQRLNHLAARRLRLGTVGLVAAALSAGCADRTIVQLVQIGESGQARAKLNREKTKDRGNRKYMYDRMQLAIVDCDDGLPASAEGTANQVFEVLRTQGVNQDRTVGAFVLTEGSVKFWKGEPFEQAAGFAYVAMQKAMQGEWDNARASALNALFYLKDFGMSGGSGRKTGREFSMGVAGFLVESKGQTTKSTTYWTADSITTVPEVGGLLAKREATRVARDSQPRAYCEMTPAYLEYLHDNCELALLPDDEIDGTACWVIEARPREADAAGTQRKLLYYAQDDGRLLRLVVTRSKNGYGGCSDHYFKNYETGREFEEDHFEPVIPRGFKVVDVPRRK